MTTTTTKPAAYGYIITSTPGLLQDGSYALGVIGDDRDFAPAIAASDCGNDLAVYPTREIAEAEMRRAAGDSDPVVYAGLDVVPLARFANTCAIECALHGYVTYPKGKPARTDYDSHAFCGA